MPLHRLPAFLRLYRWLPHHLLNHGCAALCRVSRPRWAVQLAIRYWSDRAGVDMSQYQPDTYATLEAWFLRRLLPGQRPIGRGLVSPVDGMVVGSGPIAHDTLLQIKGAPYSLDTLLGSTHNAARGRVFHGGCYLSIFLSPDGYHHIHMPTTGSITGCRYIPGRFFPQNTDALRHIDRIYERNERAILDLEPDTGEALSLVLVGASMVGGIFCCGQHAADLRLGQSPRRSLRLSKGEALGYFTFGSTVVLLLPAAYCPHALPAIGSRIKMGQPLLG